MTHVVGESIDMMMSGTTEVSNNEDGDVNIDEDGDDDVVALVE